MEWWQWNDWSRIREVDQSALDFHDKHLCIRELIRWPGFVSPPRPAVSVSPKWIADYRAVVVKELEQKYGQPIEADPFFSGLKTISLDDLARANLARLSKDDPWSQISAVSFLGLDVKITPDQQVILCEVNGSNFGMKGLDDLAILYDDSLRNPRIDGKLPARALVSEAFHLHVASLNEKSRALSAGSNLARDFLDLYGENLTRLTGLTYDYLRLPLRFSSIEAILENKLEADGFFDQARKIKPKSYACTSQGVSSFLHDENPEYFIVKPVRHHQGSIEIHTMEKLRRNGPLNLLDPDNCSPHYLIESFHASKPLRSSKDRQEHDGCMRYVLIAEQNREGVVILYHFGGYWRLCPLPISQYGSARAMVANYCSGAHPAAASKEDLALVRSALDMHFPEVYKKMVQHADAVHISAKN